MPAMLTFRIHEIPDGASDREVTVPAADLALGVESGAQFSVNLAFRRSTHMIEADLSVTGTLRLVCDRSLDPFDHPVDGSYTVLFKTGADDEIEDDRTAIRKLDLSGNELDLTRDVRDTILLSVPVRKLHPRFLDADGRETPFESPWTADAEPDPRWDALRNLNSTLQKN